MNLKQSLQKLNNHLDICKSKLTSAQQRNDHEKIAYFQSELDTTNTEIVRLKQQQAQKNSSKSHSIKSMAFNRSLTKAEQADMGKLKKSVRGLIVVHPMTALGREIGVNVVTGFAPKEF